MKKSGIVVLVLLIILTLVGCSQDPSQLNGEEEYIKIGCIQDLSSTTSVFGKGLKWGAEKAVDDINAKGGIKGKKLKLISYDDTFNVNEAINAYNKLVNQDGVVAVIGQPNSNMGIALAPVAEEAKVPIWGYFMDERATTDENGKLWNYMFLGQLSTKQQAETIANYALNELGIKKVAVLYDQSNSYSVTHAEPFKDWFEANGGEIVSYEAFQQGEMDFRVQLSKMIAANPDALYITAYVQQNAIAYNQAREMGFKGVILGNNSFFHPFASLVNNEAYDVYFPVNVSFEDENFIPLVERFTDEFNESPPLHIAFGYDAILVLVNAIERAGSTDPVAIRDALHTTKGIEGYTGTISIESETHRPTGLTMVVTKVEKDKYIPVGRFGPPEE